MTHLLSSAGQMASSQGEALGAEEARYTLIHGIPILGSMCVCVCV